MRHVDEYDPVRLRARVPEDVGALEHDLVIGGADCRRSSDRFQHSVEPTVPLGGRSGAHSRPSPFTVIHVVHISFSVGTPLGARLGAGGAQAGGSRRHDG